MGENNQKSDPKTKQDHHKSRIHTTENPFTLYIDDTPENIARVLMTAPPKKAGEWDYLKRD